MFSAYWKNIPSEVGHEHGSSGSGRQITETFRPELIGIRAFAELDQMFPCMGRDVVAERVVVFHISPS